MDFTLSAENSRGWRGLYLSLADWPDRIRETHKSSNRLRDELTFYLCFFSQAYAVRDWVVKQGVAKPHQIDDAIAGNKHMQMCRDICNRYKHYSLSNPSIDANWTIQRRVENPFLSMDWEWTIIAGDQHMPLWDLMLQCLSFWEALVVAYGLDIDEVVTMPWQTESAADLVRRMRDEGY